MDLALQHPKTAVFDIKAMETELRKLEQTMLACVQRIPHETQNSTYEDNETFNRWSRILLSALGDKNWWFMYCPFLRRIIDPECMLSSSMWVAWSINRFVNTLILAASRSTLLPFCKNSC